MTDHSIATIPPDQPLPDLSNMSLIPNYLTTLAGLRPEQIGQTLLYWTCIPLLVMTPIAVWALHRTDGRFVLFAAAALIGAGLMGDWSGNIGGLVILAFVTEAPKGPLPA